ncbi:MAG: lytic murein transglycosylase [Balneolaceae bacterium]|nr:lytic murein transglycosylase [Balneolaceae bacterium]
MKNHLQVVARSVCTSILILSLACVGALQAQPKIVQESDSLHPFDGPYQDRLTALAEFLKQEGHNIEPLLKDSRFEIYEKIGDRFRNSAEVKSLGLEEYKQRLGFEYKQRAIGDFIETNAKQLNKAEETYGVSKYVISAIIGIESDFGKNFGNYNPFNSYVSMYAVDYREDFARAQLKELLEFTERNSIDIFELKSSYAGAMSYGQFIPYSINKWFVGDDIFDIDNNILSVANYLSYFKERTGSIEKAVLRYNPSSLYTEAVLDLARRTEKQHSGSVGE